MARTDVVEVDPWLDPKFAPLDSRTTPLIDQLNEIAAEDPVFAPRLAEQEEEELVEPVAEPVAEIPPAPLPSAAAQPERIENADGTSIEIAQTNKGWKAVIDSGTGAQPEVFYGNTKDEMWANIARGKANATKQIRELTKKIKLGVAPQQTSAPAATTPRGVRDLTAEESFEIKTLMDANPDAALSKWWELKTGKSVAQTVAATNAGEQANLELEAESVSKDFIAKNPDYYISGENFSAIVAWVAYHRTGVVATPENFNDLYQSLIYGGHWTVKNLTEAFTDLSESQSLQVAPAEAEEIEQPAAAVAPPAPAAPANARIGRTVRQPRAGLGTRPSATARPPASDNPPAAEDLDNLSDKDIRSLWEGVRKQKLNLGRRS